MAFLFSYFTELFFERKLLDFIGKKSDVFGQKLGKCYLVKGGIFKVFVVYRASHHFHYELIQAVKLLGLQLAAKIMCPK